MTGRPLLQPGALLDARPKILYQQELVEGMRRGSLEAKLGIPLPGLLVDRVNEQSTNSDQLARGQDAGHRIEQERAPDMLTLVMSVYRQACEQDHGYRLVGSQATHDPSRRFSGHDRSGGKRVIAGDVPISLGRDEYARVTAAVTLQSMPAQPFIERDGSTSETLDPVR
jgi:hypothetical protein